MYESVPVRQQRSISSDGYVRVALFLIKENHPPTREAIVVNGLEPSYKCGRAMDALTALSVASSVIQFVDFGSRLLARSRQLYKSAEGVLNENVDIEVLTLDLLTLTQGLKRKLPENRPLKSAAINREYSVDDEALDVLCRRCIDIAEELVRRLDRLKVKGNEDKGKEIDQKIIKGKEVERSNRIETNPTSTVLKPQSPTLPNHRRSALKYDGSVANERPKGMQFRKWESFRKALESSWNRKEIDALAATLREFKSEIEFRVIVSFRGALKDLAMQQSQTSNQLAQSTRIILDTFLNTREELANQLRLQAEKLIQIQESQEGRKIQDSQKIENILKRELGPIGMLQTPKGLHNLGIQEAENSARALQVEEEIRLLMIENSILRSLAFPTLTDRRESVEIAYSQTFEWIYQESHVSKKPWSNFVEWLRYGSGIYWISGKAGSGKSTLMRYIYENKRTNEELQEWAGFMPTETFGFFFWNSGDLEQRSQRGLLRSLLFDILQRHQDLLPKILPDVWEAWSARASSIISSKLPSNSLLLPPEPKPWTLQELKRAFHTLLQTLRSSVKVCLFIDGLDEYDGDYEDVIELFQNYATSPNIKLCLSSRPLVVFERGFVDLPNLKLQNLTYGDISHYVKDKLGSHRYMAQLSQQHAAQVSLLIDEIVEKASGVFLWVKLVVKSLLHGLRDYNRISDLQKRVRHLPADLEALYAHMWEHTDPFYREQASQIFQIVRAAQKWSSDKVTLLNLSWADDEDETLAENAPLRALTNEEISMRCRTMDARLKSVCVGLLESNDVQFSDIAPDSKVLFLHRTVSDFFAKPDVWDRVLLYTTGTGFSPNLSMLRSCVLQIKSLEVSLNCPLEMSIISSALYYAKEAEVDLNTGFPKLLDQLDIAASYQWRMGSAHGIYEVDKTDTVRMSSSVESLESNSAPSKNTRTEYISGKKLRRGSKDKALLNEIEAGIVRVKCREGSENTRSFRRHASRTPAKLAATHIRGSKAVPRGGFLHHWSYGIEILGIKPLGKASTFYDITRYIGLSHYVAIKEKSGIIVDHDVNQHLLMHTISSISGKSKTNGHVLDPILVDTILQGGADPNFSYCGMTPWQDAMAAATSHFVLLDSPSISGDCSVDKEWKQTAEAWVQVFEVFIRHGADPNALSERHQELPGHPRLSPLFIVDQYFHRFLPQKAAQLKVMIEERGAKHLPRGTNIEQTPTNVAETRAGSPTTMQWMFSWFRL